MKEDLECSVQNEWMQVDGKGRNTKTSCGNSSLAPQLQQDNQSNQCMVCDPVALGGHSALVKQSQPVLLSPELLFTKQQRW